MLVPVAVVQGAGATAPGYELDYAQITAGTVTVSATVEGTPTAVITGNPISLDGSTAVIVEFYAPHVTAGANGQTIINVWDGATDIGRIGQVISASATLAMTVPVMGRRKLTPTNGSHTFSIQAWRVTINGGITGGLGGAGAYMPAYLRVTRA